MLRAGSAVLAGLLLAGSAVTAHAQAPATGAPSNSLASKCNLANAVAQRGGVMGGLGSIWKKAGSFTFDRFSIDGEDGAFICTPEAAARIPVDRAKSNTAAAKQLGARADVKGTLRPTLFTMPETQRRLQAIVDRMQKVWPYPSAPQVKVLLSANTGFNAEARADNTITVWLGVFEGSTPGQPTDQLTDNDLYWLLGHEYSHLALNHGGRDDVAEAQREFGRNLAGIYQRGAMLESALRYSQAMGLTGEPELEVRDAREAHRQLRFLMDSVIFPLWGRMQEDEADAAGFDLAVLSGVGPRTAIATARFQESETTREQRMDAIRGAMETKARETLSDPSVQASLGEGELGPAFKTVGDNLLQGLFREMVRQGKEWLSRDHRSAEARQKGLRHYEQAAYRKPGVFLPSAQITAEIDAILATAEMRSALAAARAVADAQQSLAAQPKDTAKAGQRIAAALNSPFGREAYVLNWAARVELASNRADNAIRHLEKARLSPNVSPEAYRELARLYAVSRRIPAAKAVVVEARRKIPEDPDYFLPEDVRVLVRERRLKELPAMLTKCRATEREQIMLDCVDAALDADYDALTDEQKQELQDIAYWGAMNDSERGARRPSLPGLPDLSGLGRWLGQ